MAELPKVEETADEIIEIVKSMNIRAGEVFKLTSIQLKLGLGYRADDINAAIKYLLSEGKVEPSSNGWIKLTQAGYGSEPSEEEVARAVLDEVGNYRIRPGEVIPVKALAPKLMQRGFKGEEIANALKYLASKKFLELRDDTPFLTNEGFGEV
ncbi:MAG: hypothetical protein WAT93_09610 [Pontixanthobacter sp.]